MPTHTARKSSSSITLVLVGASTLAACGQSPETLRRDLYASRADCVQDWGSDPAKCEPVRQGNTSSTGSSTRYYGPSYSHGSYGSTATTHPDGTTTAARPGSRAIGTAHVSRGGFGSSAASHSSGSRSSSS